MKDEKVTITQVYDPNKLLYIDMSKELTKILGVCSPRLKGRLPTMKQIKTVKQLIKDIRSITEEEFVNGATILKYIEECYRWEPQVIQMAKEQIKK